MSVLHFSLSSHLLILKLPLPALSSRGSILPGSRPAALCHTLAGKQITFVIDISHYYIIFVFQVSGKGL